MDATGVTPRLTTAEVVGAWLPLAGSWLLMSVELPLVSAAITRLPDAELQLAAYGSVVFPLALLIEAPIIMLLVASTALCRDAASYLALRAFMHRTSAVLTAIHALVAFTPLCEVVVLDAMGQPPELLEPARLGLQIMLPWTWTIAYRRFQQGVLIRFGHSHAVITGTVVRLLANLSALALAVGWARLPGAAVAAVAVASGVTAEAVYAGLRVRSVVRRHLAVDSGRPPLRGRAFVGFYLPLVMTSLITLVVQPIGSAAIGRMPQALASLAVWPVATSVVFMLQAVALAFNEVVVALLSRVDGPRILWRFTSSLALGTTACLLILVATPLSTFVLHDLLGLSPELTAMGVRAMWFGLPIPALRAIQSWSQGILVHRHRTLPVTEAVLVFILVCVGVLAVGAELGRWPGVDVAVAAYAAGRAAQTLHLWVRGGGRRSPPFGTEPG